MIYVAKIASRRAWALRDWDRKCRWCGGLGHFGALDTNPYLIVFCKCARLQQFDLAAIRKQQADQVMPEAIHKKL